MTDSPYPGTPTGHLVSPVGFGASRPYVTALTDILLSASNNAWQLIQMTRVALATALFALLLGMAAAAQNQPEPQPASVAGVWELTYDPPHTQKGPLFLTLQQEGEKVTGTYGRVSGKGEKLSGFLLGTYLKLRGGNRIIRIEIEATLDHGLLKGTFSVADERPWTWTAKRQGESK